MKNNKSVTIIFLVFFQIFMFSEAFCQEKHEQKDVPKSAKSGMKIEVTDAIPFFACNANPEGSFPLQTPGNCHDYRTYSPPPGWVIISYEIKGNHDNGHHEPLMIKGGLDLISAESLKFCYDTAVLLAKAQNNQNAVDDLQKEYIAHDTMLTQFSNQTDNTLQVSIHAASHGTSKGGNAKAEATAIIQYIGNPDSAFLLSSLMEENKLK